MLPKPKNSSCGVIHIIIVRDAHPLLVFFPASRPQCSRQAKSFSIAEFQNFIFQAIFCYRI